MYVNDELVFQLSGEYVKELNLLNYNSKDFIYKYNDRVYYVNNSNTTYCISYGDVKVVNTIINYSDLEYYILNEYNKPDINLDIINNNTRRYGAVKNINGGKQCIMSGCFVRQYDYGICWAASMATIIRYFDSAYVNLGLNAFDVAYRYAYEFDLSTDPNDENTAFAGANVKDVEYMLALYGVYYSVLSRKLLYSEIKDEIDNGYPIYMSSAHYNEKKERSGHATVLYGYYTISGKRYYKIWNPGTGAEEVAGYNSNGNIYYVYNNVDFIWERAVCKATYVFK